MVTPDEFRNGAGFGSAEKLQLAATSLAFAGAMKLIGIGVQQMKEAAHNRAVRKAKEEVQRELEAFYALHPEARRPRRDAALAAVAEVRRTVTPQRGRGSADDDAEPDHRPSGGNERAQHLGRARSARRPASLECWPPAISR